MSKDCVMLSRNDFETDVTLVCEDGEIKAHRFILSACSPFFRRVVGKTSYHVHPLLYLQGASTKILSYILDYIYLGMVHMPQEDLTDMLNLASVLKVCRLDTYLPTPLRKDPNTGHYHEVLSNEGAKKKDKIGPLKISKKNPNMKKLDSVQVAADIVEESAVEDGASHIVEDGTAHSMEEGDNDDLKDNEVEDGVNGEEENFSFSKLQEDKKKPSVKDIYLKAPPHNNTNKNEILAMLDTIVMRTKSKCGVSYQCRVCKKTSNQKHNMRYHAEKHITGFTYMCRYCGKSCPTRTCLRFHMIRKHNDKGYKTEEVEDRNITDMKKLDSFGVTADMLEGSEVEDGSAHILEAGIAHNMEDGVDNTLKDNEVEKSF